MAYDFSLTKRKGQLWAEDKLLSMGAGRFAIINPGAVFNGMELADLDRLKARTTCYASMRVEYLKIAKYREELAKKAEEENHLVSARDNYHVAALLYGWVMYSYQIDDHPKKLSAHTKCVQCYDKVIKYSKYPMERVEIPFENTSFPAILHLPPNVKKAPCVIFIPGVDMIKENHPNPKRNIYIERGMACLSIDGPGQGESNIRKIRARDDLWAYEKAVSAAIDYLEKRPEIDSQKIATFGVSTGSYWSPKAAVYEGTRKNRIKASAGMMFNWNPGFDWEYNLANPLFKHNYMYMSGVHDEDEFDKTVAAAMTLEGFETDIKCPVLIVGGDYDQLCGPEDVMHHFEKIQSPKEVVIYEGEFHGVSEHYPEAYELCADWLKDVLDGKQIPKDKRTIIPDH